MTRAFLNRRWAVPGPGRPGNRGSYVFADVSEKNVDQWIDLAKSGPPAGPLLSAGSRRSATTHPRKDAFPHGLAGLKEAVDKIHAAG